MATSNDTTYCIYRIVCFATGKCYVGQTNNPKKRKNTHFVTLRNQDHHNNHLQNAYLKYGEGQFYFEVIENDIASTEINSREMYWIRYFDSFENGYNKNSGGDNHESASKKPCVWNGIKYESISLAAQSLGIDNSTMSDRVTKGYTCDQDVRQGSNICIWNGINYRSIAEAARASGVDSKTVRERLKKGYKCDNDLPKLSIYVWNNVAYPNINEAVKATGLTFGSLWRRRRKGYTCDEDMDKAYLETRYVKKCFWNGFEYKSCTEAAIANQMPLVTMCQYVRKGFTGDKDIPSKSKKCHWNGIEYNSLSDAASALGISISGFSDRIKKGYTCDADMQRHISPRHQALR